MRIDGDEIVGMREFRDHLPDLLKSLQEGERDKIVVTRHGQLAAVLVSIDRFEGMTSEEDQPEGDS